MADLANVIVKGEFDGQELIAGLQEVSKLGKKAASDTDLVNKSIGKLSDIMSIIGGDIKNAVGIMSQGFNTLDKKIDEQKQGFDRLSTAIEQTKKKYKEFGETQKQAAGMADKMLGNTTRGAAQANRFNSANFLAQFQDIAVTSAMGMNPMLIAMQQGTQLQYILAQSNAPLKDFVAGLKSAFSTAGLLTITLTGLVAALIQTVDWTSVGKSMLNGLSDVFGFVADNADIFTIAITTATATLLVFNGSAVATTIVNLTKLSASAIAAGAKMAAGWIMAAAPIAAVIGAISGLIYLFMKFPTQIANALNKAIDFIVGFANKTIGVFKGIGAVIKELPELIKDSFKNGISSAKDLAKGTMDFYLNDNYIDASGLKQKVTKVVEGTSDVINNIVDDVSGVIKKTAISASEGLSKLSDSLGKTDEKVKKTKSDVDKLAEAWDRLQTSNKNKIQDLQMSLSLVGAGTFESTYQKSLLDMVQQAEGAGIDLYGSDNKYEQLQKDAEGIAKLTEEYENLRDKVNFTNSTMKGFFTDMRHGLRDGQSAWEAFGNAVNNVLDKILDKIMDVGVDALFNAGYGYGKNAGWWGTTGQQVYNSPIGPTMPGATPLTGAANGGVFSNGIYSSPTLFKFAKGGKFGVMGEAGPEAVMPLKRAPDGSLGVRADNSNASPVVVNVINNSNAQAKVEQRQTSQGMEIDVMIDQLVAEKMSQPGTSSNSALRAFNNQKLIAR